MALLILCYVIVAAFIAYEFWSQYNFKKARDSIQYRIHVAGVRGRSNVTRYVAAILRDAGLETYAKTAGSASSIILPNGRDVAIGRRSGTAYVNEQIDAIRSFGKRNADAIVIGCARVGAGTQEWLERRVMRSHIVIITGVHAEQSRRPQKLSAVARRLARSIPKNGYVIIDEHRSEVVKIFADACDRANSQLISVRGSASDQSAMPYANHIIYRDRLAVALAVAKLLQIPNDQALQAIAVAEPDPQSPRLEHLTLNGKSVVWADLFAVKGSQRMAEYVNQLAKQFPEHERVVILNNRLTTFDQTGRVMRFSRVAQTKCRADVIVALGDYEEQVRTAVNRPGTRFIALGNTSPYALADGDVLMASILNQTSKPNVLIIGAANEHTIQSDQLLRCIRSLAANSSRFNQPKQKPFPYV